MRLRTVSVLTSTTVLGCWLLGGCSAAPPVQYTYWNVAACTLEQAPVLKRQDGSQLPLTTCIVDYSPGGTGVLGMTLYPARGTNVGYILIDFHFDTDGAKPKTFPLKTDQTAGSAVIFGLPNAAGVDSFASGQVRLDDLQLRAFGSSTTESSVKLTATFPSTLTSDRGSTLEGTLRLSATIQAAETASGGWCRPYAEHAVAVAKANSCAGANRTGDEVTLACEQYVSSTARPKGCDKPYIEYAQCTLGIATCLIDPCTSPCGAKWAAYASCMGQSC